MAVRNLKISVHLLIMLCSSALLLVPLAADSEEVLVIGAQNIDYFPHYDFSAPHDKGFAWSVLRLFSQYSGYQLKFIPLPTRRLQKELQKGTIDFVYPDNPRWHSDSDGESNKRYSRPIAFAYGGAMVRNADKDKPVREFDVLAIPFGFSPVKWQTMIKRKQLQLLTTFNAEAALQAVDLGRADAADVEYHVAKHLMALQSKPETLTLSTQLPFNIVNFQLSTVDHLTVLQALDQFLIDQQQQIESLRLQYGIKPDKTLTNRLQKLADAEPSEPKGSE